MAKVKITFTLDEGTVEELNLTAARLSKSHSEVLREAIHEYYFKSDRLSEAEKERMLKILDEVSKKPPTRTQAEVDQELREIRGSRRTGWARPSDLR